MLINVRLLLLFPFFACSTPTEQPPLEYFPCSAEAHVWYLGANGYAVNINNRVLIFDYQEQTDPHPPPRTERNLQNGYIDPGVLDTMRVYVFVTHTHFDHYDPVILEWEDQIDSSTYFFGWEAGDNPEHYYLSELRDSARVGDMEVYTIYSHHSNVPEVAFLVKVDGYTIYHNGDYKANYQEDYAYLATLADSIDIACMVGVPDMTDQYFQQAAHLAELFPTAYMFPMNREDDPSRIRRFRDMFMNLHPEVQVLCPEQRGESFSCPKVSSEAP
ncbi:MAG: MBL fold metallo-hydrolase [Fidelibacterota bacterium]|nr:MAG: MBL fold metallo-hydrolase [Candidatus Neomarinimicrobiota bacterium]